MKAIWNGKIIAESADTVVVEGNHYFPADALRRDYLVDSSTHTTYSTLGLRGSSSAGMPGNQTRLRGLVSWRHAFGDAAPTSTLALAGQPGFAVAGVPIAKNALVLEGGIDFAVGRNLTLGVSYVGQAASQLSDHGIKASLLWKF